MSRNTKGKEFDAVVLVLDVGHTTYRSGFLDQIIRCASEQIQRKVYGESSDLFGIVLCGTAGTENPQDYDHITLPAFDHEGLCPSNFELLEFVEKKAKALASEAEGDWLDAVVVALDHLKSGTVGCNVRFKRIILFSDLGCPAKEDQLETIAKAMTREGVEFVFIGPKMSQDDENGANGASAMDVDDEEQQPHRKPKSAEQLASEAMVDSLIVKTNGLKVDIQDAIAVFMNKERKKKKPFPWKVDIEIGSKIKIPAAGYVYVRRENPKTWKKCLAKENDDSESWELKPELSYVKKDENLTAVDPNQTIESFRYGSELVTVSENDKANLYQGGPKSMVVIGFVKQKEVPLYLVLGDGSMVFQPIEGNESSIGAMSALVHAMHSDEVAALVRRVYSARTAPKLGILVPSLKRDPETQAETTILVYVEMPYMEDIRHFSFAPLFNDVVKSTQEQLDAVDDLIDAMTVTDPTILQTEIILNPYYQHLYQCLTHRALNPNRVLPGTSEHTKKIMKQPPEIAKAAGKPLQKIKETFKLEEVVYKKEKNTGDKFFGGAAKRDDDAGEGDNSNKRVDADDLSLSTAGNVIEVGTTTPVEDFGKLLREFDLSILGLQLEKVILDYLKTTFGDFSEKILACLDAYRNACLDLGRPSPYNNFLLQLKPEMLASSRLSKNFWSELVDKNLGLISEDDLKGSEVSKEVAEQFLKIESAGNGNETNDTMETEEEPSADDLLDDL